MKIGTMEDILRRAKILPVVTINDSARAVDLAHAVTAGGLSVIEVTLRTPGGLAAIAAIRKAVPNCLVGAGTVLAEADCDRAVDAGAMFAVSPGASRKLYDASARLNLPFLPGAMTPSEVIAGCDAGLNVFKYFPAEDCGGTGFLDRIRAPFPRVFFCPSGGIREELARVYASLPNVIAVAATWMVSDKLVNAADWDAVTALSARAANIMSKANLVA